MKVYKSLYTRIQYSIYLWTQDADVDLVKIRGLTWTKYLGICTSLVTMHAPWVGHTTAVGQRRRNLWRHNGQAPNITFPSTYLPVIHQSSKTNIYSALLECYYNSVLDRYWTTELYKLISTDIMLDIQLLTSVRTIHGKVDRSKIKQN